MPRKLIPLFVLALLLVAAPSASAVQEVTFRNSTPLNPADPGSTSSSVGVRNMRGPVYDMEVSLRGVTHPRPQDLDVLLVAPDGKSTVLLSDQCGDEDVSNRTWNIKSGGNHPSFSDVSCPGSYYLPTDGSPFGDFPGTSNGPLSQFHRKSMNGSWRLHVVDDQGGEAGALTQGWSLTLRTDDVATSVPALGTSGHRRPLPDGAERPARQRRGDQRRRRAPPRHLARPPGRPGPPARRAPGPARDAHVRRLRDLAGRDLRAVQRRGVRGPARRRGPGPVLRHRQADRPPARGRPARPRAGRPPWHLAQRLRRNRSRRRLEAVRARRLRGRRGLSPPASST